MIKMSLLLQFYDQKYPLKMIFCLSFWKFHLEKVFWKISRARLAPRVCVFVSNKPVSSGHFVMNTVRVSTIIWSSRVHILEDSKFQQNTSKIHPKYIPDTPAMTLLTVKKFRKIKKKFWKKNFHDFFFFFFQIFFSIFFSILFCCLQIFFFKFFSAL